MTYCSYIHKYAPCEKGLKESFVGILNNTSEVLRHVQVSLKLNGQHRVKSFTEIS